MHKGSKVRGGDIHVYTQKCINYLCRDTEEPRSISSLCREKLGSESKAAMLGRTFFFFFFKAEHLKSIDFESWGYSIENFCAVL